MKKTTSLALISLATAILFQPALASAQSPPSGEPPRSAPRDPGEPTKPLITLENRQSMLGGLYDDLARARDAQAAKPIIDAIWKVWSFSGSATSDVLMERAQTAAADGSLDNSLTFLNAVIELQPNYAHGWFLRGMALKLKNDGRRSLTDLRQTLSIDPHHFEALKSLAFELNSRGEKAAAFETYAKLLQNYPAAATSADPVLQDLQRELGGRDL